MKRLTAYLSRLFVIDAMILFGVVCVLLWLVNCLRSFDVVSVKGQGLVTLALQALLTMPPLALTFFYVCMGIGLARALLALQASRELHIIHTSYGLPSLWRATGVVAIAGVVAVLLISNFLAPMANKRLNILSASVAADLISTTLKPKRFTQVTPGVLLLIGGRAGNGEITEFFADDRRDPEMRHTYMADTARVSTDGQGYVIELYNGALQYTSSTGQFSEISFSRYDLNVERLSQTTGVADPLLETDSVSLVGAALASGEWPPELVKELSKRMFEALKVVGICMLVLAICGFPSGRRTRFSLPMEVVVMLLAFVELGVSAYSPLGSSTGALLMMVVGGTILLMRARPRHPGAVVPV
ncbi:LptF/LptG family permease [Devosia sp. ZW T5_3]|uniref:LptF/LptG family permease n=1 Tax=Devosia sp. ZW T5_3 TaxID=3378085 RepID=UPI003851E2D0